MPEADSFLIRVKNAIKGNYRPCMWRSLQSIVLYEADRCIKNRYPHLEHFQKQIALLATAADFLEMLDFLNEDQRLEIMFSRRSTREPLAPVAAWRRMLRVSIEVDETILPKAKQLVEDEGNERKSHDEICELILQRIYEESSEDSKPKTRPPMWEYNHVNVFAVYRMYFRGVDVDPNIFPTTPLRVVEVPAEKPPNFNQSHRNAVGRESPATQKYQFDDSVVLTDEEKRQFADEGYLQVKQVVPAKLVHAALGAISAALCKLGGNVEVHDGTTEFCPGVGKSDAILNLIRHSTVWTLAQRLLGRGNILEPRKGQIAPKAPNLNLLTAGGPEAHDASSPPTSWHIDGMDRKNRLYSPFSLLVGITLSDVLTPNRGNLCVFPKSHKKLLPLLKEQLESGSPVYSDDTCTDKPAFHNGVQLLAEAGDAVFVHQKTAHRPGPNASHMIRYQVYFRLTHKDHTHFIENGSVLEDLFVEFEGLHDGDYTNEQVVENQML